MSDLNMAITLLINCFSKYAKKEGDPHTLNRSELKTLLQNELGDFLGKTNDKEALDKIFDEMDSNKDDSVDFCEFGRMVFALTMICHEFCIKKQGCK